MHPELLVRAIRRPRLELLAEDLKDQRLLRIFAFFRRRRYLEPEYSVLFRYRCTHLSDTKRLTCIDA